MKKKYLLIIVILAVILGAYFMPFITVNSKNDRDISFKVPFLSSFKEECCMYSVTFNNLRSTYALKKDLENAIASYEKITCKAVSYYYDESQDIAISEYGINSGFPFNEVYYVYGMGNPCEGWSIDDETKYPFGDIKDVNQEITEKEAEEEGYLVVKDGVMVNTKVFDDFFVNVSNVLPAYIRVVEFTNGKTVITDVQCLEEPGVLVTIDDLSNPDDGKTERYDNAGTSTIDGDVYFVVFNGNDSSTDDKILIAKTK